MPDMRKFRAVTFYVETVSGSANISSDFPSLTMDAKEMWARTHEAIKVRVCCDAINYEEEHPFLNESGEAVA